MNLRDFDHMPPIAAAMTPFPHFVESDATINTVESCMKEHKIRHLPVQDAGEVVGIVSQRDLQRLVHPSLPPPDKERIHARDVMLRDPYVTEVNTPLDEVLEVMVQRRLGSVVVVKHGKLAGIFSTVDACRLLAHVLEERFPPGPGDAA